MIVIRLKPVGTKSRKQWRVVVADSRVSKNGSLLEEIGHFNPVVNPPEMKIRMERYTHWLEKGAKPSETLRRLIQKVKG